MSDRDKTFRIIELLLTPRGQEVTNALTNKLKAINKKTNTDLEAIILDLLKSKSVFKNTKLKPIENDIGIVYTLRNSAAHRIRDRPFIHENFKQIVDSLFNIIFLTIEKLYIVKI